MTDAVFDGTVEIVRGQLSEARALQILEFWSREGALEGTEAHERLAEVVCVLIDAAGDIAGVNSAYATNVPLIGGRRFWIYRRFLPGEASRADAQMLNAAFTALEKEFDSSEDGPVGLCVIVADPALLERRPEAVWPDTELILAGHLQDGSQVRLRYFWDAVIGPGVPDSPTLSEAFDQQYPLEDRFRIEVFGDADAARREDVIAIWEREGVVSGEEAERRVQEVILVATEEEEGIVGISSAYLARNRRLRMDLWHYRLFVADAHRGSNVARAMAMQSHDLLERRFISGEDSRGPGIVYEIENEGLKMYFNRAVMVIPPEFTFIGLNRRGDHVRVRYFPGAQAPLRG